MANVFQMSAFKHHPTRTDFDLSRKNLFSAKIGELLPVSCREIIPGDRFKIKPQHFTRTVAVNSAAYTTIREYVDYYFVPTRVLWRLFPDWINQQNDQTHFASGQMTQVPVPEQQPFFTVQQLHEYVLQMRYKGDDKAEPTPKGPLNLFGFARAYLTVKLLQYLGYGDYTPSLTCGKNANYTNYYQQNLVLNPFPLFAYQAVCDHFHRNTQWTTSHPYLFNLDYIFGNSVPQFDFGPLLEDIRKTSFMDLQYGLYHKDYFMGVYPDSQFGAVSVISGNVTGTARGVPSVNGVNRSGLFGHTNTGQVVSYEDGPIQARAANADQFYPVKFFNYPRGHKTNSSPVTDFSFWLAQNNTLQSQFSILQLRMAEAKQKWAEVTMSNYYDYVSQTEAHFGVRPNEILSHSPRWVGSYDSTIGINEVINQNITGDNQAYIAGKGVGTGQGTIDFDAEKFGNENGYLIGIYHAEPLLDYATNFIEKQNTRSLPTDYAIPEYENVGMQAVNLAELTNSKVEIQPGKPDKTLLGYGPRYYDYKTTFDVVNGIFRSSLNYWAAPVTDKYVVDYLGQFPFDVKLFNSLLSPNFFKINPHLTDAIFGVETDSSIDTDCLLVNFYEDVKASRKLSKYGLPY